MGINIYVNEPDVYESVDFGRYTCVDNVYPGDRGGCDYGNVDAILVGLRDIVDDKFLERFRRVRYVVSNTTGVDHIRTRRAVEIIHLDPREIEEVSATAEFTLGLLLSLVRKIPFVVERRSSDRRMSRGVQLRGKTMGIFGMGRLGKRMARYAEALDMSWMGYDLEHTEVDKHAILERCDVLTLHLPLTRETAGFIGQPEFERMARRPFLINTSRPQLIDKQALIDALERSLVAGVAMDFVNYDGTNVWDPSLEEYMGERLLMTPHIAGNTYESVSHTARIVVEKLMKRVSRDRE